VATGDTPLHPAVCQALRAIAPGSAAVGANPLSLVVRSRHVVGVDGRLTG
jgi:O6-methylguanine-DNA--protein-cysteine methyltransferase